MRETIYNKWKDAVVLIHATGSNNVITENGQYTGSNYSTTLTGFFIEHYYIVTNLSDISYGTIIADGTTYFASSNNIDNVNLEDSKNLINFYNLQVRVRNVIDHCSYSYKPTIIGIDASRNVAVLKIDPQRLENIKNPPITNRQPYLRWGKSRELIIGQDVYLLKNQNLNAQPYIKELEVMISPNFTPTRTREYFGINELLSTSYNGSPLIDSKGYIVGFISYTTQDDVVLAQYIIEYIVRILIEGIKSCFGYHLTETNSNNLEYSIAIYVQPLIGIAYQISTSGNHLIVNTEQYLNNLVNLQIFNGTLHSLTYKGTTYELGVPNKDSGCRKTYIHPIQVTYTGIIGDSVELIGTLDGNVVKYNLKLMAPVTKSGNYLLFVPHTPTGIGIGDRFPNNTALLTFLKNEIIPASYFI